MAEHNQCTKCGDLGNSIKIVRVNSSTGKPLGRFVHLVIGGILLAYAMLIVIVSVVVLMRGEDTRELTIPIFVNLILFGIPGVLLVLPYATGVNSPLFKCENCGNKWTEYGESIVERCPKCNNAEIETRIYRGERSIGLKVESKESFTSSILLSIGGIVLGIGLIGYAVLSVTTALQSDSCSVELIALTCEDQIGGLSLEITVNLLFVGIASLGGLSILFASLKELWRYLHLSSMPKLYEFTCPSCVYTWTYATK
ncbi:MAG TPA: hypothetical protein VJ436_06870 [Anaerolineales bacterium]|nr:hypothetical protein [Anaerolineales bacterium]